VKPVANFAAEVGGSNLAFYSCLTPGVCSQDGCAEGYMGGLCADCAPGYGKTSGVECSPCPTDPVARVVVFDLLMILMLTAYVYRLRATGLERLDKHMIAVKILFTGLQVNSFVLNMRVQIPTFARNFFVLQGGMSQIGQVFFSYDCASSPETPLVYQQALLYLLSPLIVITGSFVIATLGVFLKRAITKWKRGLQQQEKKKEGEAEASKQQQKSWLLVRDYTTSATVLTLSLLHPGMALKAFNLFHCVVMGAADTDLFLTAEPSVRCSGSEYTAWIGAVGVPLLLLVILIPVSISTYLLRNRAQLTSDEFMLRWAFVYKGYQPKLWCVWESFVMARKAILVAIFVFLPGLMQYQALLAMFVCGVSIFLHLLFQPFSSLILHRLELLNLTVSTLLYFFVQFLAPLGKNVASIVLIFLSQLGFFVCAVVVIGRGLCKKVKRLRTEHLSRTQAKSTCGDHQGETEASESEMTLA